MAQLVEYVVWDHGAGGSSPLTPTNAGVAELADALDLGSSVFDVGVQVLSPAPFNSHFEVNLQSGYFAVYRCLQDFYGSLGSIILVGVGNSN